VTRGAAGRIAAVGLLLAGCSDTTPIGPGGSSGDIDDTSTTMGVAPPVLLGAPEATTPGSLLYVVIDVPLNTVDVSLGEVVLEPERFLMTDDPAALLWVPDDTPLGPSTLRVSLRDHPEAEAMASLEVRAPWVRDVADAVGLAVEHDASGSPQECAESHTGLAWGDYDGDGLLDVYFGNVGSEGTLHRGLADGTFEEVTTAAGLSGIDAVAMATFVDIDGDGDRDLYVGRRGENRLLRNLSADTGDPRFEDISDETGIVVDRQRTMGVAFGDYDGDGDLDLYEVNHAFCFPQANAEVRARDHLLENEGGVFVERTPWLDSPLLDSVGFSAAWLDTDRDGDPDLVVINDDVGGDIGHPNAHWRNDGPRPDGGWRFTEVGAQTGLALPGVNGMGLAYGDLNDDGYVDLAFTNIGPNHVLLSRGNGAWNDASTGVHRGMLPWARSSTTWAVHLPDLDNDGDLDFYASGGRIKGQTAVVDAVYENLGDLSFLERTWDSGMADHEHGKASALVDFDRDGGLDIVTTVWGGPARVYRNALAQATGNHWVAFELQQPGANRDALGAIVTLEAGGRTRTCFHSQRPALGSGSDHACHFGLGSTDHLDALRILWPDGSETDVAPLPAVDQRHRIVR
jgi:hypothetical protein